MIGIGELVLLLLAFLFAGGAISRLAKWAFFRRASGTKQVLWALADWIQGRKNEQADSARDHTSPLGHGRRSEDSGRERMEGGPPRKL